MSVLGNTSPRLPLQVFMYVSIYQSVMMRYASTNIHIRSAGCAFRMVQWECESNAEGGI
jgi:hypothetical protein